MKRIIAILTTVFILIGIWVLPTTATDTAPWSDKIEAELLEKMESMTEDELVSIYIWRNGGEYEAITRVLREDYNMDPAVYEDSNAFKAQVAPAIEEAVRIELAGQGLSEEDINTKIDEEIYKEKENYRATKLLVYKSIYKESNDKFLATYVDTENRRVEYVGAVTGTIILDATKEEIIKYANAETVTDISWNLGGRLDEGISGDEVFVGDVNGDGEVNNLDASTVLKYDAAIIDGIDTDLADYNGDGAVNNLDAAAILKYDAGLI